MLMQIDGTFILVVVSFLIFLFIIKAILFNPINKIIDERNSFYAKNSQMEVQSKEKTKALLDEKEGKIKQAKVQAADLVKQISEEAKKQSSIKLKEAKLEANNKMQANKNELLESYRNLKIQTKAEISTIVQNIASKVLKENIEISLDDETINSHLGI